MMWCRRLLVVAALALAVVVCGCKDRKGQAANAPQANPDGVAQSDPNKQTKLANQTDFPEKIHGDPTVVVNAPQVHRGEMPRLVIWDPIAGGEDKALKAEGVYFAQVLRTAWFTTPEFLVDVQPSGLLWRLLPREGSAAYRPFKELTDEDLSARARAFDAKAHLWIYAVMEKERPKVALRLIDARSSSVIWRAELAGSWGEIGAQLADKTPEVARALGVTFDARQEKELRRSVLGTGTNFVNVARKVYMEEVDYATSTRAMDDWAAAEPELEWVRGIALANHVSDSKSGAKEKMLARLNEPGPFNGPWARRLASAIEDGGDNHTALKVHEALATAQPTSQRCAVDAGYAAYRTDDIDKALQYAEKAEKIGADHWIVHLLFGDVYLAWVNRAQRGRTINHLTPEEQKKMSDGVRLSRLRFSKAAELNPWDAYPKSALGASLMRGGGSDEQVFRLCREAYDLNPGNEYAISTMIWACAPGYSNRRQTGLDIFMEYHAKLKDTALMIDLLNPMRQIIAGKMRYDQMDVYDGYQEYPLVAIALGDMGLRAMENEAVDGERLEYIFFYTGSVFDRLGVTSEYAPILKKNYHRMTQRNEYTKQWNNFNAGWILEEYGEIETAYGLYDLSSQGPDERMRRRAECRKAVVVAKRGDVATALGKLAGTLNAADDYAASRIEVLLQGSPAQRRQAVELAEETLKTNEIRSIILRLGKAYNVTGEYQKTKEVVLRYCDVGEIPERGLEILWKKAQKGLGETEVWPPPDDLIRKFKKPESTQ